MSLDMGTAVDSQETVDWITWELPKLTHKVHGNTLLFDAHSKTLYSIGGYESNKVFALHLDEQENEDLVEWKWKELPPMKCARYNPSCTLITNPFDKKDEEQQLLVIGGRSRRDKGKNAVEVFDLKRNKWSELETKAPFSCPNLYRGGIYYDEKAQRVYIGGGQMDLASARMHYLDLKTMEWEYLPNTNWTHNFSPILWKDHNEILYITSTNGDGIEWLDLRQHQRDLKEQAENGGVVDINFTKKWGLVTDEGNVEYEKAKHFVKDKRWSLSRVLNCRFPKDCSVARLLSAHDFS